MVQILGIGRSSFIKDLTKRSEHFLAICIDGNVIGHALKIFLKVPMSS